MEETRLHLIFLISAYLYAIFCFITLHLHLHPDAIYWPNSLLRYLSSSPSSSNFLEPVHNLRFISLNSPSYPIINEKDVVALGENNFTDIIRNNRYVAVDFYAPWCGWCRQLAPEYAAAATAMKGSAVFAKVDATVEVDLAKSYEVEGFPTIYFFIDGVKKNFDYKLERNRDSIVKWLKDQMNGGFTVKDGKRG